MTAPAAPSPFQPGDKLRVTVDHPYGSALALGDLVTVTRVGVAEEPGRGTIPVVYVSTAHGPQILGVDAVEPWSPPAYVPAEPDDVTDARLRAILAEEPELRTLFTDADTALGATDDEVSDLLAGDQMADVTSSRRVVGQPYHLTDADGDRLQVTYVEQDCPRHGREGLFFLCINDDGAVCIPTENIDGLIRFLLTRRNHSRRTDS